MKKVRTKEKRMYTGKLLVIDGLDGSGKGKQIDLLKEKLVGFPFHFTREPGGTPYAEKIREVILHEMAKDTLALTEFLLFWAARTEHLAFIKEKLAAGTHVISDRFDSSTLAFQIYGKQKRALEGEFGRFRDMYLSGLDITYFILDLPPEVAYERMQKDQARSKTHFDLKPRDYHERVRKGFLEFGDYANCIYLDANRSPEAIHEDLFRRVQEICLL